MPATDKEIIAQLIKIAEKQRLIINKLAQGLSQAPSAPQHIPEPMHPSNEIKTLINALPPELKPADPISNNPGGGIVQTIEIRPGSDEVHVRFAPGKKTQANYDAVMAVVQQCFASIRSMKLVIV